MRRELVQLVDQGRLRAMDISRLEISPVTYYPTTGQLEIVESMDVAITFERRQTSRRARRSHRPDLQPLLRAPLRRSRRVTSGFHDAYPDRVGDVVTMVVVTPPMFAGQLQDFVAWKTERGFHTILAVTGTPEVGTTTA